MPFISAREARLVDSTIITTRPLFDCTHNAWLDLSLSVQFVYNARLYNWVRRIMRSLERRVPLIIQCYTRCCTLHSRISRMYSLPWRPTSVAEAGKCGTSSESFSLLFRTLCVYPPSAYSNIWIQRTTEQLWPWLFALFSDMKKTFNKTIQIYTERTYILQSLK